MGHVLLLRLLAAALFALPAAAGAVAAPEESPEGSREFARENASLLREVDEGCKKGSLDLGKLADRLERQPKTLRYLFAGRQAAGFVLYRACLGTLPGHDGSCDILEGIQESRWQQSASSGNNLYCHDVVEFAAVVKAAFKKGDAVAACQSWLRQGPRPQDANVRNCEFLVSAMKGGGDESYCRQAQARGVITEDLIPQCLKAMKTKGSERICMVAEATGVIQGKLVLECRMVNAYLDGSPKACPPAVDSVSQGDCRERASFLAGMRSSDPKVCAASPFCAALTSGKPQACAPYLAAATKVFCGNRAAVAQREGNYNDQMQQAQKLKLQQAKEEFSKVQKTEAKALADKAAAEIVRKAHQVEGEKLRREAEVRKANEKPQFKAGQRMMLMPSEAAKGFKMGDEKNPPPGPPPPDTPPTPQTTPQGT